MDSVNQPSTVEKRPWEKYEASRVLTSVIDKVRRDYRVGWISTTLKIRQRAVAMYFIDHVSN